MVLILSIIGGMMFLYLFWHKLKDEYASDQIFSVSLAFLFSLIFGVFLGKFINYWFWVGFSVVTLITLITLVRKKLGVFEGIDALVYALFPLLFLSFIGFVFETGSLKNLIWPATFIFLFFLYRFLEKRYKQYRWYRSGKIGFLGLIVVAAYFLIRGVTSLVSRDVVSLVEYDFVFSSLTVIIVLIIFFRRANEA